MQTNAARAARCALPCLLPSKVRQKKGRGPWGRRRPLRLAAGGGPHALRGVRCRACCPVKCGKRRGEDMWASAAPPLGGGLRAARAARDALPCLLPSKVRQKKGEKTCGLQRPLRLAAGGGPHALRGMRCRACCPVKCGKRRGRWTAARRRLDAWGRGGQRREVGRGVQRRGRAAPTGMLHTKSAKMRHEVPFLFQISTCVRHFADSTLFYGVFRPF